MIYWLYTPILQQHISIAIGLCKFGADLHSEHSHHLGLASVALTHVIWAQSLSAVSFNSFLCLTVNTGGSKTSRVLVWPCTCLVPTPHITR